MSARTPTNSHHVPWRSVFSKRYIVFNQMKLKLKNDIASDRDHMEVRQWSLSLSWRVQYSFVTLTAPDIDIS